MNRARITIWSLVCILSVVLAAGCGSDDPEACDHEHEHTESDASESDAGHDADEHTSDAGEDANNTDDTGDDAGSEDDGGGDPDAQDGEDGGTDGGSDNDAGGEICDDGLDNDDDDDIDCDDADCASDAYCEFGEQYLEFDDPSHGHIADPNTLQGQQFDTDIYYINVTANQTVELSVDVHNADTLHPYVGVWELNNDDLPTNEIESMRSTEQSSSFQVTFAQAGEYMVSVDDSRNLPEDGPMPEEFYGADDYTYTIVASEVQ